MFRLKPVGYSVKGKLPLSTKLKIKPITNKKQIARQKQNAINLIKKGTQTIRNLNAQRKIVDRQRSSIYQEKKPSLIQKLKPKKSIYE
jgi:hypothetical protein